MNIDDFIMPSSIASPAGFSEDSSVGEQVESRSHAVANAIPIKKQSATNTSHPAASVPHPPMNPNRMHEFDYVPRHVRKTSIDDRRVRFM